MPSTHQLIVSMDLYVLLGLTEASDDFLPQWTQCFIAVALWEKVSPCLENWLFFRDVFSILTFGFILSKKESSLIYKVCYFVKRFQKCNKAIKKYVSMVYKDQIYGNY